jgi:hypothetical protein
MNLLVSEHTSRRAGVQPALVGHPGSTSAPPSTAWTTTVTPHDRAGLRVPWRPPRPSAARREGRQTWRRQPRWPDRRRPKPPGRAVPTFPRLWWNLILAGLSKRSADRTSSGHSYGPCRLRPNGGRGTPSAHGVEPAAADSSGMSGLHWAAGNGHLPIVELLTARGAPLEGRNMWEELCSRLPCTSPRGSRPPRPAIHP